MFWDDKYLTCGLYLEEEDDEEEDDEEDLKEVMPGTLLHRDERMLFAEQGHFTH